MLKNSSIVNVPLQKHLIHRRQTLVEVPQWLKEYYRATESFEVRHFKRNKAARVIQRHYLKWKASLLTRSCVIIQTWWRMVQERNKFQRIKTSVLLVQNRFRIKQRQQSATRIQKWFRTCRVRDKILKLVYYWNQIQSSIKIQSVFRMHLQRDKYLDLLVKTKKIQKWFKSTQTINRFRHIVQKAVLWNKSATKIQLQVRHMQRNKNLERVRNILRMYVHRRRYLKQRQAIVSLQKRWKKKWHVKKTLLKANEQKPQEKVMSHIEQLLAEKKRRLAEIQAKKEQLEKSLKSGNVSQLTEPQMNILTKNNTQMNDGFKFARINVLKVEKHGLPPPSPSTILENRCKNRTGTRTFLPLNLEESDQKHVKWKPDLIELFDNLATYQTRPLSTASPKKSCLKASKTYDLPEKQVRVPVSKFVYSMKRKR